ncbi:MAG: pyridoxal 5'-phosphate synthase glutaminase subunit PdxT [Thermoplasmata archaeon]|nr:pyridoxal 5'-phosphate synthase glutaminase subunit PdxT [Thermoplasmata archaeon]
MNVGVLALQGDVSEHIAALESAMKRLGLDGKVIPVRRTSELANASALLMPGGESTTIAKQLQRFGLREPIIEFAMAGKPVMGTCAGCILLAKEILDQKGPEEVRPLGLIDISIRRNAFGRQKESFERPIKITGLEQDFPGIFIRAPKIERISETVESLAMLGKEHIMVKQGNVLALTFHPELGTDDRVHALFLKMLRP